MPKLASRLARLEKDLRIDDGPKSWSLAQLVTEGECAGEPEATIKPGERSLVDLILAAGNRGVCTVCGQASCGHRR